LLKKLIMAEFDTGLPSVRQVQGFIKDGTEVELKLLTQDVVTGYLRWQDVNSLCISTLDGQSMIVSRHAIAYIKSQGGGEGSRALQVRE
jgi:host factor-I protein